MVLDVYSAYVNNFTNAMEVAKRAAIQKPAFRNFIEVSSLVPETTPAAILVLLYIIRIQSEPCVHNSLVPYNVGSPLFTAFYGILLHNVTTWKTR